MIILKTLTWSNCFSYGENNALDLETHLITQLVGTNGAGKSSIPLILEEALFNKNSKGVKKAEIANRHLDGGYKIGLDFEVDGIPYSIRIDRKSSLKVVLEKDGEDISSHTATNTFKTIETILGLDFKTFSQLVYQNTNSSLQFLTATDTNRKKFLIELLNLDNYLELFENFKKAHKDASDEVSEIRGSIDTLKSWIDEHKLVNPKKKEEMTVPEAPEELVSQRALIQSKLDTLAETNAKINKNNIVRDKIARIALDELTKEVPAPQEAPTANADYADAKAQINQANTLLTKMNKLGDSCPTCLQDIDKAKVQELIDEQEAIKTEFQAKKTELETLARKIKEEREKYTRHQNLVAEFEKLNTLLDKTLPVETSDAEELKLEIADLTKDIQDRQSMIDKAIRHNADVVKFNTELDFVIQQIKDFKLKLLSEEGKLKTVNDTYANLEVLKKAFSTNGLVAYKIENLVKDLEDMVNEYLGELSDGRFGLQFVVNSDKLNVVISDEGNDIDILALSSGELARVNTSTLLAIRKLMSTLSKSKMNVLFLDEVISVLDDEGKERLIEVLLKEQELNTFLVSHGWTHPLLTKATIVKENNISRLEWQ